MATKSKLLVRSHAIQESASPPPSPFKQELKEQEDSVESVSVVVPQKSNHDLHLPSTKKEEDSQNTEKINLDVNNKRNSGAIQKSVNINVKETEKIEKPKIKTMGSSSSFEGASSGFISRESSYEQHVTDHNGVSLLQFFHETLNKNAKDRNMLLKIEKELYSLATDKSRTQVIFPPMCSYNRMLIHRVAAYFGMEHNVDATQQCVIAGITKLTRVPDIRFKTLINDGHSDEYKKSILKRSAHSFDECRQSEFLSAHTKGTLSRKTKSFEERQNNYEKIKHRIFKDSGNISMEGEWSRSSSVLHDETKSNETRTCLPDYQCQVLELLKSKRNDTTSVEGLDRASNDNPCKYGALWAVTDIMLVPKGSILIDPQTLKPIVNSDNTIYTYDPDNFPPNFNKYQGPIVKLNDVKINLTDEVVLDPPQVDHTDPSCECKEKANVDKSRYSCDSEDSTTTVYFKTRSKPLPFIENEHQIKPNICALQPAPPTQMKFQGYQPKPLSPDKLQFEHPARFSLNCPFTYTMTNNNTSTYWTGQHIPFRIPPQEFGMPLSIHGAYIPSHNHKNHSPLRIDEKPMEMPLAPSNHPLDPRFTFCSYAQGAFPPTDHNQIAQTAPAVINIFGQLNSHHNIIDENTYKVSNSAKKMNNEALVALPCNCTSGGGGGGEIQMHETGSNEDKTRTDERFKYGPKNYNNNNNNNMDKKFRKEPHRFKFQNSIQPHSTNFHDIRLQTTSTTYIQDGEQHRIVHSNLGPNHQQLHNGIASGNQYTTRKNNHVKSDRL